MVGGVTDLQVIHVMLVLQATEFKNCGVMEASTKISKESLRGQAMYSRIGILQGVHERVMCESVRVKQKMQWKPQKVGDTRNIYQGKSWAVSRTSPGDRPYGLSVGRP
jgi:hypothetical protein